jgi:hypothetical protein
MGISFFLAKSFSFFLQEISRPAVIQGECLNFFGFGFTLMGGKFDSTAKLIISKNLLNASFGEFSLVTLCHDVDFITLQKDW